MTVNFRCSLVMLSAIVGAELFSASVHARDDLVLGDFNNTWPENFVDGLSNSGPTVRL